jgi:hypothetical protein
MELNRRSLFKMLAAAIPGSLAAAKVAQPPLNKEEVREALREFSAMRTATAAQIMHEKYSREPGVLVLTEEFLEAYGAPLGWVPFDYNPATRCLYFRRPYVLMKTPWRQFHAEPPEGFVASAFDPFAPSPLFDRLASYPRK